MSFYSTSSTRIRRSWLRSWAVMLALSVSVLLFSLHTAQLNKLQNRVYISVYMPISRFIQLPLRAISQTWKYWQKKHIAQEKLEDIIAENEELRAQIQLMRQYQAENLRLRMLMESAATISEPILIAELLDIKIEGYRETMIINKGENDGVYLHQSVIDSAGLVGQVVDLYPNSARVMLITDGRSRVPVYIERTMQRGLVLGSVENGALAMAPMELNMDIKIGDKLVSSGLGGVFPRGYPVAEVTEVVRHPQSSSLTVTIKPLAHLQSMLEVFLVSQRTTSEKVVLPVGPPPPTESTSNISKGY